MLAERGSDPHVPDDCAGDAWRETFRSVVAAGAVLLKDAGAFFFLMLLRCVSSGGPVGLRCCCRRIVLRRGLRKRGGRQDSENWEKML